MVKESGFRRVRFSSGRVFSFLVLAIGLTAVTATATISAAVEVNTVQGCKISEEDAAGLNGDAATDVHATSDYSDAARRLLMEGEFDQLDCLAAGVRSRKEKFSGGVWKIHTLYSGLSDPQPESVHPTESDWQSLLANLQRWVDAKPNSVTGRIALAAAYTNYAWVARGSGYSDSVSSNGWQEFSDRMAKARQLLEQADTLSTKCPEWYVAMLDVAQGQGWDLNEIRALYQKAAAFEPGYYYYDRQFASFLQPKWFGEEGDTERFAEEVADQTGGDRGDALYFQIASEVICGCSDQPKFSWQRIVKGSDALEKLDGPSMLNLNLMAKMGAYTSDMDATDAASEAFARIGDQWDVGTWKTLDRFEQMRKSFAAFAPKAAKRQAATQAAAANARTSEGIRYLAAFGPVYRKVVEDCVEAVGNDFGSLQTLTEVGADGTITDMSAVSDGAVAVCVFQKFRESRQQNKVPFPVPPHAAYWVRLDFTKSDLSIPVAAK